MTLSSSQEPSPDDSAAAESSDHSSPSWFTTLSLPGVIAGYAAAVSAIALVVVVVLSVISSQLKFSTPALEDAQVRLYGVVVVFGLVYALIHHSHVRMDLLRQRLAHRYRIIIEILGVVVLQIPMMAALTWWGWDKFLVSWHTNEVGGDGNGLPWLWSAKAVLPLGALLVVWVSVLQLIELCRRLRRGLPMIADEDVID